MMWCVQGKFSATISERFTSVFLEVQPGIVFVLVIFKE